MVNKDIILVIQCAGFIDIIFAKSLKNLRVIGFDNIKHHDVSLKKSRLKNLEEQKLVKNLNVNLFFVIQKIKKNRCLKNYSKW